jgi:L-threonylcarbamoyladenylate synthase
MMQEIKEALKVIKAGGVIVYPTDTIWGIGCDATNEKAVAKVFEIKKRCDSKSLIILLDDSSWLPVYVKEVPEIAWQLVDVAVEPLTIIYPQGINLAKNVLADDGSIAIRITADSFCKELIKQLKKPLVSTSANISGEPAPSCFDEINVELVKLADYVVKHRQHEKGTIKASSIIKVEVSGEIKIIRK